MTTIGEAFIRVSPDASGFASEATSAVGSAMKKIAEIAGAVVIGKGIVDFFQGSVADAATFNASMRISAQVIKDTGGSAGVTIGQVDALARSISVATGVNVASVSAAEQVVLSHRNIQNAAGATNDVFNRTIQDSTDLAAVMGTDTTSAAKLLGRALDDPTQAAGALHRAGVVLTQGQQDQIKAFTASGNVLGAQKVVLDALEKSVGGAAAAGASATDRLKASWADLKLTLGQAITPSLGGISTALAGLLPAVAPLVGELGKLIGSSLVALAPAILIIAKGMTSLGTALAPIIPMLGGVVTVLAGFVGQGMTLLASFLGPLLVAIGPVVKQVLVLAAAFGGQFMAALKPLMPILAQLAGTVLILLGKALGQILAAVGPLLPVIGLLAAQMLTALVPAFLALVVQGLKLVPLLIPLVTAFVQLLPVLLPVVTLFANLVIWLSPLAPLILAVLLGFEAWAVISGIIEGITGAFEALNVAMDLNPFLLMAIGIAALAYIIYRNWDTIVGAFKTAWHAIEGVMGSIADVFRSGWHDVQNLFEALPGWFASHWQLILAAMTGPVGLIVLFVKDHFGQIVSFLEGLPSKLLSAGVALMKGLLNGIVTGFADIAKWMIQLPVFILAFIIIFDILLVQRGIALIKGLLNGISNAVPAIWAFFTSLPGKIFALLVTADVWLETTGVRILTGLANGIVNGAAAVWSFFSGLPGRILGFVGGAIGWLVSAGSAVIRGLINGITGAAPGIWSFLSGLPGKIIGAIPNALGMLAGVGKDIIQGLINGIGSLVGSLTKSIENAVSGAVNSAKHALGISSPSAVFHEIGVNMMRGLANGITGGAGGASSALTNALAGLGGGLGLNGRAGGATGPTTPAVARGPVTFNTVVKNEADMEMFMRKVNFAVTAGSL